MLMDFSFFFGEILQHFNLSYGKNATEALVLLSLLASIWYFMFIRIILLKTHIIWQHMVATNSIDWYSRVLVIYIVFHAVIIVFTPIFAWSRWITGSIWPSFLVLFRFLLFSYYVHFFSENLMIWRTIAYIFNSNSMHNESINR